MNHDPRHTTPASFAENLVPALWLAAALAILAYAAAGLCR